MPYISDIELTHDLVELYLLTKNCSEWLSLGRELNISERNLDQILKLYQNEEDSPVYANRARVTMMHRFLTLDPDVYGDINQKIHYLAEALVRLDCKKEYISIGIVYSLHLLY